jgi:protein JSN1
MYYTSIPAVQSDEREHSKRYATSDPSRIRETKKRLETGISQIEADGIGLDLLEDSVGLSSDYIGNVIIQRLFEQCSDRIKIMLLERIAPHLASIGCHKNGTWAAQKIIERASTPEEVELICRNLKPYTPALLLGGFSNYVVQGTLRFGSPASSFVFDAMVDRCW